MLTEVQQQIERDVRSIMNTAMTDTEKTVELIKLIADHRERAVGQTMTEAWVFSRATFGDRL